MRIIYFSSIRWDYSWHRQQEIVSFLANEGFEIYFIEPFSKKNSIRRISENITLVSCIGIKGERTSSIINRINGLLSKKVLLNLIDDESIIFFDRVHGINFKALLSRKNFVVYDLIDEITAFGRYPNKKHLLRLERKVLERCNLLLSSSSTLLERKKVFISEKCKSLFIPNGVDISRFSLKRVEEYNRKNFVIGFLGTISKRSINTDFINYIAKNMPECNIKLIGPYNNYDINFKYENINIFNSISKNEVAEVLKSFDIGIIPYNNKSDKMDYVFPKKALEYLAVGLPVVSTGLKELEFLDCEFIKVTDDKEKFVQYIKEELLSNSWKKILNRRKYVNKFNWDMLLRELSMELIGKNE